MVIMMLALAGCGAQSTVEIVTEEKTYPEPDTVAESLEGSGFSVERFEKFEELGIDAVRVKAVNGDEYLDICYSVSSMEDMDAIVAYYTENYKQYNLVSDTDVVYCYSSESVEDMAGLQE